jgi:hypothetical protein
MVAKKKTSTSDKSKKPAPRTPMLEPRDSLMPVPGGVSIAMTQAYGPTGESLMGISDVMFDDNPAITIWVERPDGKAGLVHLSPVHGDKRKAGFLDIAEGAVCKLFCPVSKKPLDKLGPVDDASGADYYAIYATKRLKNGPCVMISNVWGHYHSRIVDDLAADRYWLRTHPE